MTPSLLRLSRVGSSRGVLLLPGFSAAIAIRLRQPNLPPREGLNERFEMSNAFAQLCDDGVVIGRWAS
jgi:hypothetical protein